PRPPRPATGAAGCCGGCCATAIAAAKITVTQPVSLFISECLAESISNLPPFPPGGKEMVARGGEGQREGRRKGRGAGGGADGGGDRVAGVGVGCGDGRRRQPGGSRAC